MKHRSRPAMLESPIRRTFPPGPKLRRHGVGGLMPDLTPEERDLGMGAPITRRDFVNAVSVGAGAGLLAAAPPGLIHAVPAQARAKATFDPWTGPGGVGDYARANGNTWS